MSEAIQIIEAWFQWTMSTSCSLEAVTGRFFAIGAQWSLTPTSPHWPSHTARRCARRTRTSRDSKGCGSSIRCARSADVLAGHEQQAGAERNPREQAIDGEYRAHGVDQDAGAPRAGDRLQGRIGFHGPPGAALVHRQQEDRVVEQHDRKTPEPLLLHRQTGAPEERAELLPPVAPPVLVVVVARRPERAQRRDRRHAEASVAQDARDLANGAGVVVEMLERLAARHAIEHRIAKRQPSQIAEDRGQGERALD